MHTTRIRALAASSLACFGLVVWLTAVPTNAQIPTGAVAHWKFDDTAAPGADSVGSYNATLFGNALLTPAKNNSGLGLDGADDYATVSSANGLETASFAVSAWINCTSTDTNGGEIVSLGDNYGLRIRNSGVVRAFVHDSPTHWTVADSTVTVNDGAWHHLVGQFDSSNGELKVYIDGVAKASATAPPITYATGIHDLFIGHHGNGSSLYDFNGRLDHIRLYSRALTDADVSALNAEAPKILTWNLRKGRATNNSDSINGPGNTVSSFVKYVGADVLLLSATETLQEATDIRNQLGGTWSVDWHKSSNSNEGQAILSRFEMPTAGGANDRDVHEVTQATCQGATENQVIVFDTVVINGVRYAFFAIDQQHLSDLGSVRGCQATEFSNWIVSKNVPEPHIVAGDFNTDSDAGITNWTSPANGYFDGWPTALKKFGYASEGSSLGNTTGRTKKTALDHILYSKTSGVTPEAAQVWDTRFLYPGTTCANVTSDSFLQACSVPCSSCAYVDDKSVRPSDHIPFTLIVSR